MFAQSPPPTNSNPPPYCCGLLQWASAHAKTPISTLLNTLNSSLFPFGPLFPLSSAIHTALKLCFNDSGDWLHCFSLSLSLSSFPKLPPSYFPFFSLFFWFLFFYFCCCCCCSFVSSTVAHCYYCTLYYYCFCSPVSLHLIDFSLILSLTHSR